MHLFTTETHMVGDNLVKFLFFLWKIIEGIKYSYSMLKMSAVTTAIFCVLF